MTPPARLALFVPTLFGGGAERVMVNLSRGFVERGYRVDLVVLRATGPYGEQVPSGVRMVELGSSSMLASLPRLARYLRLVQPAALLSTLTHANLGAIWAKRLARVGTRIVVREANQLSLAAQHSAQRRDRLLPYLVSRFYPYADGVVAVSEGVAADLTRSARVPLERIRVLYNPVLPPDFRSLAAEVVTHPWLAPGEPPLVLAVGRLTQQKDFPTLLRAFALVREQRPARLLVLGEGGARRSLQQLIGELGLESDVSLHGFVDNPFKYMARAAVLVLSSRWEGMPGVLIQALACGTPVVSTDCESGPRELLRHGELGRLVPVGDVPALAGAIESTLAEPHRLSMPAAWERFTFTSAVDQYLNLLVEFHA